jgi:hypothetical protein
MKAFDSVALTHDIPAAGLKAGDIGVVVEIYRGGAGYEVEFVTRDGDTAALLTLKPNDIVRVETDRREYRMFANTAIPHMVTSAAAKQSA